MANDNTTAQGVVPIFQVTTTDTDSPANGPPRVPAGDQPLTPAQEARTLEQEGAGNLMEAQESEDLQRGITGLEGEQEVWEGTYSLRNFVGRALLRVLLTVGWITLAAYTWGYGTSSRSMEYLTIGAGVALLVFWIVLVWQMIRARMGHSYRLTNRRLFVNTGVFNRRRDQLELLKVKDIYIKQTSLWQRMMGVGTVVIETSEERYPVSYLPGVEDPQAIMDLLWNYSRAEREGSAVQVDQV